MSDHRHQEIADHSPSVKLVYTILAHQGPQTQKQLIEASRLSPRTVRYALTDLNDAGIVTESVYLPDARQSLYELTDPAADGAGHPDSAPHAEPAGTASPDD